MSSRSPWAKKKKKNNNKQNQHKKIRANNDQSASELVTGRRHNILISQKDEVLTLGWRGPGKTWMQTNGVSFVCIAKDKPRV